MIYDFLDQTFGNSANIVDFYRETLSGIKYPTDAWFPKDSRVGLDLMWLQENAQGPKLLDLSKFDTMPSNRPSIKAEFEKKRMPFFREEMYQTEEDLYDILLHNANDVYMQQLIADTYNDQARLILGARASMEMMKTQLMFDGSLDFVSAKLRLQMDYGFDAATQHTTLTGSALWSSHTTATPIEDMIERKRNSKINSKVVFRMNQETFDNMMLCQSVLSKFYAPAVTSVIVSPEMIAQYLTPFGISIEIVEDGFYDPSGLTEYTYEGDDKQQHQFVIAGKVSMYPEGNIGRMWLGTSPEEVANIAGLTGNTRVSIVEGGVAVISKVEYGPPVKLSTTASMIALPTVNQIKKLATMKVM